MYDIFAKVGQQTSVMFVCKIDSVIIIYESNDL